jgi:ABC-type sugar transport system, permease component
MKNSMMKILVNIMLIIICVISISPLVWVVSTSFKTNSEVTSLPPTFFPKNPTVAPYIDLWKVEPFLKFSRNSIIVSISTAILVLIISSLAAYGLSRFYFPKAKIILTLFLISQMFPGASIMIPISRLVLKMGLYNTLPGLIFVNTAFLIPFSTWMLYGFFKSIPKEIEEAASIDGCSRFTSLIKIILPLSLPGIGATFIFTFLGAWNEYLFALVLTNTYNVRTLTVGLAGLVGQYITQWNVLCAGAIIFSIPPLILFFLLEKSLVSGLTAGAVKE